MRYDCTMTGLDPEGAALSNVSASDAYRGIFDGALDPGAMPALLLVDLARAYFDAASPLFVNAGPAVLAEGGRLAGLARRRGIPVIFSRMALDLNGTNAGLFYRKVPSLRLFLPGSPLGDFADSCRPQESDVVVDKQYPSAFFGTSLASTLHSMSIDTVVIGGFSTSGCVRATALDALGHGFVPIVARDGCGDHPGPHQSNLFDLQAKYAEVRGRAEVDAILSGEHRP